MNFTFLKIHAIRFWPKKTTIMLFLAMVSLMFCSDRERLNPIDPHNPETGGRPQGLRVYSEYDQATLRWLNIGLDDFVGYNIYRKTWGEEDFQLIYTTPPDSQQFIDKNLIYDQQYEYFITVQAIDFESLPSSTVAITLGPTFVWATDVVLRYVLKLTHDCSSVIERIPVDGYPYAIELIANGREIWYTDILMNRIYGIDGERNQRIIDYFETGEPIDMTTDSNNDHVWVADETRGAIFVYNGQGGKLIELSNFRRPYSIDMFYHEGGCWLADRDADKVYYLRSDGGIQSVADSLNRPTSVSVNQRTGECWVADSSRVLVLDRNGAVNLTIDEGLIYPLDVAVDSELGNCWVLDYTYLTQQSKLFCFTRTGQKLIELSGFTQPENLIVNPYDHSCIVANSGGGIIYKISRSGFVIGKSTNHVYPYGLAIEY